MIFCETKARKNWHTAVSLPWLRSFPPLSKPNSSSPLEVNPTLVQPEQTLSSPTLGWKLGHSFEACQVSWFYRHRKQPFNFSDSSTAHDVLLLFQAGTELMQENKPGQLSYPKELPSFSDFTITNRQALNQRRSNDSLIIFLLFSYSLLVHE